MEEHFLENNLKSVGSKPTGLKGVIAGKVMNLIHAGFYKKIINNSIIPNTINSSEITVLDIGCGGGTTVKSFSSHQSVLKTCGIDYSKDMVKLSRKLNQKKIDHNAVEVLEADVSEIPYENNYFDIITAFDTINFWPDHSLAIMEILRVLKKNGTFFIINAYPKPGTKWHDFVKFKDKKEYESFLSSNGLSNVSSMFEKNTIIVWGTKS